MSSKVKNEIKRRVNYLEKIEGQKLTSLEISRKLKSLSVTQTRLQQHRKNARMRLSVAQADIEEANKSLKLVKDEIAKLHAEMPNHTIVTEHALLRYIERVMNIDLQKIHDDIIALPDEQKITTGKTIITVYTDPTDHLNLAEKEKEPVDNSPEKVLT